MRPIEVQVITYAPTVFYHCQHCEVAFKETGFGAAVHREQAESALPDDLKADFHALADWAHDVRERYGDQVRIKVIDVASIQGFWKSYRHGAHEYPAVIIEGKETRVGADLESLNPVLQEYVAAARET
jgi:hypothetical protein